MAITVRGTSAGPNSSGTSTSISLPAGVAVGDVSVIAFIQTKANYGGLGATLPTLTPPAGWQVLCNKGGVVVCWRAFQSGDPTTGIACSSSLSNWWESICIAYSGLDTAAPIDSANSFYSVSGIGASIPVNNRYRAPSLNPNFDGSRLLCIYGEGGSTARTIALPSGLTAQVMVTNGPNLRMCDKGLTDGTATGDIDTTCAATRELHFGMQVALKAASAAAATPATTVPRLAALYNETANVTTVALPLDALNVTDGDMVVFFAASASSTVTTAPSGYTQHANTRSAICYTHLWHTGDTLAPSFTFGAVGYHDLQVAVVRKVGAGAGTVTADQVSSARVTGASPLSVNSDSLTPSAANELLIEYIATGGASSAVTWSGITNTGLTEETISTLGPGSRLSWKQPPASPTGVFSATATETSMTELSALTALFSLGATGGGSAAQRPVCFVCT